MMEFDRFVIGCPENLDAVCVTYSIKLSFSIYCAMLPACRTGTLHSDRDKGDDSVPSLSMKDRDCSPPSFIWH